MAAVNSAVWLSPKMGQKRTQEPLVQFVRFGRVNGHCLVIGLQNQLCNLALTIHNPNARRLARYFYRETLSRLNRRGAKGPILNSPDEISRGQSQFDQR